MEHQEQQPQPMILDVNTLRLLVGFAKVGAPDDDTRQVIDSTFASMLGFIQKMGEEIQRLNKVVEELTPKKPAE